MTALSPQTRSLVPVVLAGVVTAILDIIVCISFAAMIFSAELSVFLPRGIGIVLFSTVVICAILAVSSQLRGVISVCQDAGIVVLAVVAQQLIEKSDDPTANSVFVTLAMFIALSSLFTALFFLTLGRFRLGNLVRFIPYPVIGGFLAAVGLILFQGAFSLVADYSLSFSTLGKLVEHDTLIRWLPALVFGIVLFGATRLSDHYLTMPLVLILGVVAFFGAVLLAGESVEAVQQEGWMLGPFSESSTWKPIFLEDISAINWDMIIEEMWHIPSIALVSAIALLLNISGLEVQADEDVEVNQELQTVGLTNVGVALAGGFVGFQSISVTMLGWRMTGKSRLVGLVFAFVYLIVLVFGFDLIAYFPKFVLGGLLIFLGIAILAEWVYEGWSKMPFQDYVVMVLILVIVATVGYLEGVGFGILAAASLFTFNYSCLDTIRQTLTGQTYQSKVDRPHVLRHELQAMGDSLTIHRLNGYIFFGSANSLLEHVIARVDEQALPKLQYLVLDFQQVQAVDTSAILTFTRLHQLLHKQGVVLVFCELNRNVENTFRRSDFDLATREHFHLFAGFDEAVEWCEDRLLIDISITASLFPTSFEDQLALLFPDLEQPDRILSYMERLDVPKGTYLARQGERSSALYWVESGRLRAQMEANQAQQRVRTAKAGTVIGEMALYTVQTRSASIVADEPSVVYVLSKDALVKLEKENPEIAVNFHRMIAKILSERLADTTDSLRHYL